MKTHIGYQGYVGSNAEEAAKVMLRHCSFCCPVLVPLVSSKNVIEALENGEIDYGVVAIENTIGGLVIETATAMQNTNFERVQETTITIQHDLFKLPETSINELSFVASHIQALKQTRHNREKKYRRLLEIEIPDTAIGAMWLSNGTLTPDTAVLCRNNAGLKYGLELIEAHLEDQQDNKTRFAMYHK